MTDSHLHHHGSFTPAAQQESPTLKHIPTREPGVSTAPFLWKALPLFHSHCFWKADRQPRAFRPTL